jgi:proline iminopeptidase
VTKRSSDEPGPGSAAAYLDNSRRADRLSGGVRLLPIHTAKGTFRVWTRRFGNNPRIKLLLLHGGPGCTPRVL